jgi:transposase
MSYKIAGIDVHKKMLAVVVSDVEIASEYQFERRMFGGNPVQLSLLAAWLVEQEAEEVVMESTAQYWKPVWGALERYCKPIREKREGPKRRSGTLHLAQAQSNCGRRGRKKDFVDAERLVKRLVARELTLSFVPDVEQRLWRAVTRKKYQLRRELVRSNNQLESLLEETHKLSSLVSDLLGVSARRMLNALADGETNPAALAALAHERLQATPEQLCDALGACTDLKPVYRQLLKMALEQLQLLEQQIDSALCRSGEAESLLMVLGGSPVGPASSCPYGCCPACSAHGSSSVTYPFDSGGISAMPVRRPCAETTHQYSRFYCCFCTLSILWGKH